MYTTLHTSLIFCVIMRVEKTLLPTFLTLESKDLKIKDVLSE
jgi:hypothetical protein